MKTTDILKVITLVGTFAGGHVADAQPRPRRGQGEAAPATVSACAQLAAFQSRPASAPEPQDVMQLLERAAAEVAVGRDPTCGARVAAGLISHGMYGRAVEASQAVAARYQGMPAARCVGGLARLAQIQRAAGASSSMPAACDRDLGLTGALVDVAEQCALLGEPEVTRAVLAALQDVAFVCRDTGALAAVLGAFAMEIPPGERPQELVNLLEFLRQGRLPYPLTDAMLVARLQEWLRSGAPLTAEVTFLYARARDLLLRLRTSTAASDEALRASDATLLTARSLLAASGLLTASGPGNYGRLIEDLELARGMGLLEQPVVSEAAATMPLARLAGVSVPPDALAPVVALRGNLRAYTSPPMCLVRFRLAQASGVREPSQEPCERARALEEATTEFLGCDGACGLGRGRYARELHIAADEGLAAARRCASGTVVAEEFERILDALEHEQCPQRMTVEFTGATRATGGVPRTPGGSP